ncbi:MAG: hypothetical protein ACOZAM_22255 [Pseudomonadota bacterium]
MTDQMKLLSAIAGSSDQAWLMRCRDHNSKLGNQNIVEAVKRRLLDLGLEEALKKRPHGASFEERMDEALRVYEECLKHKHGRKQAAGYTRRSIRDHGYREALIRTVRKKESAGLALLAKHERLDCSYEQIAIDFAASEDLPEDVVKQALRTLERYKEEKTRLREG